MDLNHILNWRLKPGSHKFPGPEGGTCINEAAIVAAGFKYRSVASHTDCPPCFSPVLSQFAIHVNDHLDDASRQELLMPLVTRLAGSRDPEDWVEDERAAFILRCATRDLVAPVIRYVGRCCISPRFAADFMQDEPPPSIEAATRSLREAERYIEDGQPTEAVGATVRAVVMTWRILRELGEIRWPKLTEVKAAPAYMPTAMETETIEYNRLARDNYWPIAATLLTRAFRIGTQAPAADTAQVVERMEAIKVKALERA